MPIQWEGEGWAAAVYLESEEGRWSDGESHTVALRVNSPQQQYCVLGGAGVAGVKL